MMSVEYVYALLAVEKVALAHGLAFNFVLTMMRQLVVVVTIVFHNHLQNEVPGLLQTCMQRAHGVSDDLSTWSGYDGARTAKDRPVSICTL